MRYGSALWNTVLREGLEGQAAPGRLVRSEAQYRSVSGALESLTRRGTPS